jgi:hypothetical protein
MSDNILNEEELLTHKEMFKALYDRDWDEYAESLSGKDAHKVTSYISPVDSYKIAKAQIAKSAAYRRSLMTDEGLGKAQ